MSHVQERLHEIPEACERLGIGRSLLYNLIKDGKLRTVKIGKRRLISESSILDFIHNLDAA
jgi:excisionase family DNA binding protein